MAQLCVLFFLSGASGLIYELVWVRQFGIVFGNTVYSASLVIAVFMSGLGVGSYAAGVWADRRFATTPSPATGGAAGGGESGAGGGGGGGGDGGGRRVALVRTYGVLELLIAGLGCAISLVLPELGAVSAAISTYVRDGQGWYVLSTSSYLARYAIAVGLLLPVTLLMGGTLSVVIRHAVQQRVDRAGWTIGVLYGVNTAGAAVGCLLTDLALIPAGGLRMTQMVAVALNLFAALGALRLARREASAAPATTPPHHHREPATTPPPPLPAAASARATTPPPPPASTAAASVSLVALALLLSGVAAMGMEIVWFRHLTAILGGLRSVLSLLLTVILAALCAGAFAGGLLQRRVNHPVACYAGAQALFVVSSLLGLATADITRTLAQIGTAAEPFRAAGSAERELLQLGLALRPILSEVGVPALLMGCAYPLANACVQRTIADVGRRAGLLYLANTVGAVLGSLATGFVLLPTLGMQASVTALVAAAALGVAALAFAARRESERPLVGFVPAASLAVMTAAVVAWTTLLPSGRLVDRTLWPLRPGERRLTVSEGVNEIVSVTDMPGEGRRLMTNGHAMSGTGPDGQRYMRAFAHVPLLSVDEPRRVLVICFGVGTTVHAASLHPTVERLDVVDLSRQVLEHADDFAATNGGVIHAGRVRVFVNDGRHHLLMQPRAAYDVITLEPPPIALAGVASLYTREFYDLVRTRLAPHGYVTQWLPVYQVPGEVTLEMVRAFVDVFPGSVLLSGWMSELILVGAVDGPAVIDPARVAARLRAAPAVAADLTRVDLGTLTELVGMFAASGATLTAATDLYAALTDDHPSLEYALDSRLTAHRIPESLFNVGGVATWCPTCFVKGEPVPGLEALPAYLRFFAAVYRDSTFLDVTWPPLRQPTGGGAPLAIDGVALDRARAGSAYVRRLIAHPTTAMRDAAHEAH